MKNRLQVLLGNVKQMFLVEMADAAFEMDFCLASNTWSNFYFYCKELIFKAARV